MPPKVKCFTKATNEGKPYTTCLQGEKQLRDGEAPKKTYPYIKKGKATKVSAPAKKASMPTKVAPKPRVPLKAKVVAAKSTDESKFFADMNRYDPTRTHIIMNGKEYVMIKMNDKSIQSRIFDAKGKHVGENKTIYQTEEYKISDDKHHRSSGRGVKQYMVLNKEPNVRYVNNYKSVKINDKTFTKYKGEKFNTKLIY